MIPNECLIIRRTEPRSPVLVSAIGSDLDATIFHEEAKALGLHVSVEEIKKHKSESKVSDEPYYNSFSGPATMATLADLDDLILAIHDLMRVQLQQTAQTTQLQQQLVAQ